MNNCIVHTGVMSELVGLQPKSLSHKNTDESENSEGPCSCGNSLIKLLVYKCPSLPTTNEEKLVIGCHLEWDKTGTPSLNTLWRKSALGDITK